MKIFPLHNMHNKTHLHAACIEKNAHFIRFYLFIRLEKLAPLFWLGAWV